MAGSSPAMTKTALENLGAFIAAGVRGRVTATVQERLALHVMDTVAAWVAASRTAEAQQLEKFRATLPQTAGDPSSNIAINCARVRLSEVDDIHLAAMITPGSIIIPAALSMAEALSQQNMPARPRESGDPDLKKPDARLRGHERISGSSTQLEQAAALREAIVAGYEVMIRLGLALDGPSILYRGIWPTYYAAAFGVAAPAARLLNLSSEQTTHALALSLSLSPQGVAGTNSAATSRWIAIGNVARNGWFAAQAAKAGFTSANNLFEGPFFTNVFGITPKGTALTEGLGDEFLLSDVCFKPWCAARQTMAATQAFREILGEGIDPAAITSIEVNCPPPFLRMIDHSIAENDRLSRLTSMPYQLAIAAFNPTGTYDVAQLNTVSSAERALMDKVKVAADEKLMAGFPAVWSAKVRVTAGDVVQEKILSNVPGDPARPFDARAVAQKFHAMADQVVGPSAVDELIALSGQVLEGAALPSQLLEKIAQATGGKVTR